MKHLLASAIAIVVAVAVLTACGSSPRPRLYALDTGTASTPASDAPGAPTMYIAAITVPEAVDRPQLVLRRGASEVLVLEHHRWAEPLGPALGRVLARQLGEALGTPRVGAHPGTALVDAAVRIQVEVQRLDAVLGEAVTMEAVWSVRRVAGGAAVAGRSVATAAANGEHEAIAAGHVEAMRIVSRDIAQAVRQVSAARR